MRSCQTFFIPFLPNPFCYVEVENGKVRYKRFWGKPQFNLPLAEVEAQFEPAGRIWNGNLLGTGTVSIGTPSSKPKPIANVIGGGNLCEHIVSEKEKLQGASRGGDEREQEASLKERAEREEFDAADRIPEHVTFSNTVLEILETDWLEDFIAVSDPGLKEEPPHGGVGWACADWLLGRRRWVNQGEPIWLLRGTPREAAIISPVSGLILTAPGSSAPSWFLLPEGAPAPLPTTETFGPLCDYVTRNRERLLRAVNEYDEFWQQHMHYRPMEAIHNSAQLDDALRQQLAVQYKTGDIWTFPSHIGALADFFKGRITVLAEERADIARALEKVLAAIENEGAEGSESASPSADARSSAQAVGERDEVWDEAGKAKWTDAQREAMQRYKIEPPFSRAQLQSGCERRLAGAQDETEKEEVWKDYEVLLPFAAS